jgi:hypothetical protein
VKARDFIASTLQKMWEDMQTDPDYWPDPYDLTHLGKIVTAQRELAAIEAMPDHRGVE